MTHVCKLKKTLYGLKKDPRDWYGRINSFFASMDFTKNKVDPNLYLKVMDDEPVDVIVTLKCIHLYILCIVSRCLFWEVSVMNLSHVMP